MRNWTGFNLVWALSMLLLSAAGSTIALAEDPASPADVAEPAPAEEPVDEQEKGGIPFGLYLAVAYGSGQSDEMNTGIASNEIDYTLGAFEITDQSYGRAAIGWKLPHGKGDFRLTFQGLKEEEYEFHSQGLLGRAFDVSGSQPALILAPSMPWWNLSVEKGQLLAERAPPNCIPDPQDPQILDCVTGPVNRSVSGTFPDDLQNRIVTYDAVYGREFGGRRYSSRWWGGLRYFEYDGQLLSTAWLGGDSPGEGFTDGAFLRLLYLTQETSGLGPYGSWEADFNFFDKALQLYIRGEAAFTFNSMSMDSGPFFQILNETTGAVLPDRLSKDLSKSTWQDKGEIGVRLRLKMGLELEVAYAMAGYLDIILMPDLLQLGVTNENPQTFTQDMVVETVHFGAGFQF